MGKVMEYMPSCHSTNDTAKTLMSKSAITEGVLVITDNQTSGRGQRGHEWYSGANQNLTFSVILKPNFLSVHQQFYLNMISSLAVRSTIDTFLPESTCQVKWPNDVYLNEQKVAGILIENSLKSSALDYSIMGIGLNVNQKSFKVNRATSIAKEMGGSVELQQVLETLLQKLENLYLKLRSGQLSIIKESYLQYLLGFRVKRTYRSEVIFEGEIIDVKDSGFVLVKSNKGVEAFDFKEIEFVWD